MNPHHDRLERVRALTDDDVARLRAALDEQWHPAFDRMTRHGARAWQALGLHEPTARARWLGRVWRPACRRAGLPDLSPHDLRLRRRLAGETVTP